MLDILSLDIFTFVTYPIIRPLIGELAADRADFITQCKRENIATLMRRLGKHPVSGSTTDPPDCRIYLSNILVECRPYPYRPVTRMYFASEVW